MSAVVWCSAVAGGVRIVLHVSPGAKRTEVLGLHGDALKMRLQAPPIEGRANEALIRYLSDILGVPRSAITLTHGQTSRRKMLEIRDVEAGQVVLALTPPTTNPST